MTFLQIREQKMKINFFHASNEFIFPFFSRTGLILSGFAAGLCVCAVLPPNDISYWVTAVESMQLHAATLAFIKFYVALPATFHTFNGVRHLLWDNGKFLKLDEVYKTGYTVCGLAVVAALILAAM